MIGSNLGFDSKQRDQGLKVHFQIRKNLKRKLVVMTQWDQSSDEVSETTWQQEAPSKQDTKPKSCGL